jgi:hypothetical protein
MRKKQLAVVGGNFYYETPVPLMIAGRPVIAFERDAEDRFLLNVDMPSLRGEARVRVERNDWIEAGAPFDLESPPNGRLLKVRYEDGDWLRIEFRQAESEQELRDRYPNTALMRFLPADFEYPLLTVVATMRIGPSLRLDESQTQIGGTTIRGMVAAHCGVGLSI